MDTEDGQIFIKNLAYFVRTHEKALANALQLQRQAPRPGTAVLPSSPTGTSNPPSSSSTSSVWAAALSLPSLTFTSQTIKPAKLTLTPHHLFYLLSRFEDLNIPVGPMNVRLENIHTDVSPTNYVSFLSNAQRNKTRSSDRDSIHSVSSIRSVMSGMSSLWSSLRIGSNSAAKAEKQKAQLEEDLKYLFSAFTKIPCLRLAPDHKARLIAGYEEFPFDSAVPLFAFKNVTALEIYDVDFRQFYGWDRLAENLRSLTVKRAGVDDPADLLINIVLDDIDKRRRRSAKAPPSPSVPFPTGSPATKHAQLAQSESPPASPIAPGKQGTSPKSTAGRQRSASPTRPPSSRHSSTHVYGKNNAAPNIRRSSGSSGSSVRSTTPRGSSSNLLSLGWFPSTKWRFLRHLSLADNALTNISATSLAPLANNLQSLDLSANLFTEIPDSLATLTCLRALNLSNCMIEGLHSLGRNPLPAINTLNLRSNRLTSLAGVERLLSLERVDFRDNKLTDPTEVARLTGVPEITEIYVHRNPFCKSYGNYRVTIFNLFRKTPGYTEDIVIDSTGPSNSEKKQLVDRVPEPPNVPIMKPPPEDDSPPPPPVPPKVVKALDGASDAADSPKRTGSLHRSKSGKSTHTGSLRKKKAPKRRIVELAHTGVAQPPDVQIGSLTQPFDYNFPPAPPPTSSRPVGDVAVEGAPAPHFKEPRGDDVSGDPAKKQTLQEQAPAQSLQIGHQQLPPLDTTIKGQPLPQQLASPPEFDVSSDLYKKKIEALRQDFGNTWLSALGDDSWENASVTSFPSDRGYNSPAIRPTLPRTPSQGIVSGGRTLG
ncbi:leucine rich repeat protein [Corynespora cassiicola Philippines]|uniref:Leucine rich repeat protein n=1 Tax=Corynespora cassiicola Philippines TaxID=1448308 RepID=A0A2T2NWZ8_CORCC|nr:leucine rich repeat protein [Corynespora cassiicola Philippines]